MTAQVNSMKIDELIAKTENRIASFDSLLGDGERYSGYIADKIALATLKAHKQGYKMFTYDYSERDLVEAECELSKLLEGLER